MECNGSRVLSTYRFKSKISLGNGGDHELRNRVGARSNFIENVPIALLLVLFLRTRPRDKRKQFVVSLLCEETYVGSELNF